MKAAQTFLEELLRQPDITRATEESLDQFSEPAIQVLNQMIRDAQQKGDTATMDKLQQVVAVLQKASAPPELSLVEHLLQHDEAEFEHALQEHDSEITPQFMDVLGSLATQLEMQPAESGNDEDRKMGERVQALYRAALRRSMKKNM